MPIQKKVNKDFFKKWTCEMAYILGFFAADGYITYKNGKGAFWCIDISDKIHLEKIKKIIQSEHKISTRYRKKFNKYTYRLQIGSVYMCNDLRKLGFLERKTKNLSIPNVPHKYFRHFVRGYFDGDGHVWSGEINKGRNLRSLSIQTVFTSASIVFLENLRSKLEQFGINRGLIIKSKGNYFRLAYSINGSLNLYNFMYNHTDSKNPSIFLDRKKKVFERFIKLRS